MERPPRWWITQKATKNPPLPVFFPPLLQFFDVRLAYSDFRASINAAKSGAYLQRGEKTTLYAKLLRLYWPILWSINICKGVVFQIVRMGFGRCVCVRMLRYSSRGHTQTESLKMVQRLFLVAWTTHTRLGGAWKRTRSIELETCLDLKAMIYYYQVHEEMSTMCIQLVNWYSQYRELKFDQRCCLKTEHNQLFPE